MQGIYIYIIILPLSCSYDDQLLVDYRVKCREGDLAFFNVTTLDLQGRDCIDEDKRQK